MDKETQNRLDSMLEDELRRGYRVKAIPKDLQLELQADGSPALTHVRFTRMNPRRKAKIAEAVQRRYHKDLQDKDILSNEQIAKLVGERGEWTTEQATRMFNLLDETQSLQAELYAEGLADARWEVDLLEAAALVRSAVDAADYTDPAEKAQVLATFERWVDYHPRNVETYTTLYAAEQELPTYSPDKDLAWLVERMPGQEASDTLQLIDDLRHKALRFLSLQEKRRELAVLQNKHAKIFADSVESRRDQSEEMARVYYCTERADANEQPQGPLCATLDELWDFSEHFIRWLIIEHYFFANGLADEAREYLETFGFMQADREQTEETNNANGESAPSVESPDPQSSSSATPPLTEMVAASLA